MTPDTLRQVGELLYGARWRSPLARDLGVEYQTVWSWMRGDTRITADVDRLQGILAEHRQRLDALETLIRDGCD